MTAVRYLRTMINGVPVVAAPAEIDITTAEQLQVVLVAAAGAGHPAVVVVDMNRTLFCDSSGLHTLLRAHKRAMAEGGELRLVVPADGAVPRVMNLTGLNRLIPCFSSLAEAVPPTPAAAVQHSRDAGGPATVEPRARSAGGQVVAAR